MRKILEKVRRNRTYSFGKDLYDRTMRDDVAGLAAQLAYFFLLAIFLGSFLITLLGFIPIQTEDVLSLLEVYVPDDAMNLIEVNVDKVVNQQNGGLLSFGLLSMLWFASNGVNAVMNAFNRAYDVKETRSFITTRALSIVFTLAIIFMIVFALIVPVFGQVIGAAVFKALGLSDSFSFVWSITRLVASFFVLFALFSFLYTFAPDRKLKEEKLFQGVICYCRMDCGVLLICLLCR